ncbi:MAG: hypothetical protein PHD37_14010 [Gallionellaceae bacterium]|nr:hypothetical protein [Gallionellaceae bacterium]
MKRYFVIRRRGSSLAGAALVLGVLALALVLLDSGRLAAARGAALHRGQALARSAQLTDPALFTEARYARHASQADYHAAFQDHPMALEHFPAGSLMPPPVAPASRQPAL